MVDGIVSEPGEQANDFVFITPDDSEIKTGEFIHYTGMVEVETGDGEIEERQQKIFGRVTHREQRQGYPDRFMSDPNVSPQAVAGKLGIATEGVDLYRITATVIGYYDDQLNDFTNPRIVPQPGTEINLASNEDLEKYLTEAGSDEDGSAFVGDLLHRPPGRTQLHLPIDNFASTHLSILASTGSGKSYTASVLVEEMMQPDSRAAMLIVDPHAEYGSLMEMEEDDRFSEDNEDYSPEVEIWTPDDIFIRISQLSLSDLFSVVDDPSDAQEHVLSEAWRSLKNDNDVDFEYVTLQQLKDRCEQVADNESTAHALEWRLDKALDRDLFHHSNELNLSDLLQPGQVSILQLDTVDLRDQRMLVSVLFSRINRERVNHEKGRESELDFPVFGLLEEGHRFAPGDGDARSLGILSTILSEGRKFGIGISIISQRPSKVDDDVLSQCKTQIIMQIQNPVDQDAVRKGVEHVGEDLLEELPGLTPGQAVIAGDSVNTPFLARIRERYTTHEAESLEATELWRTTWQRNHGIVVDGIADPDTEEGAENRDERL
jgi:DNA helicase HerA-like ATPase